MAEASFLLRLLVANDIMQAYNYFNKYERGVTMNDFELQERLDLIEFRMDLLFSDDPVSRLLYEAKITRNQEQNLVDLMSKYREMIDADEKVISSRYETEVFEILPQIGNDYHFCESYAKLCYDDGRWQDVFEALYKNNIKFQHLFE